MRRYTITLMLFCGISLMLNQTTEAAHKGKRFAKNKGCKPIQNYHFEGDAYHSFNNEYSPRRMKNRKYTMRDGKGRDGEMRRRHSRKGMTKGRWGKEHKFGYQHKDFRGKANKIHHGSRGGGRYGKAMRKQHRRGRRYGKMEYGCKREELRCMVEHKKRKGRYFGKAHNDRRDRSGRMHYRLHRKGKHDKAMREQHRRNRRYGRMGYERKHKELQNMVEYQTPKNKSSKMHSGLRGGRENRRSRHFGQARNEYKGNKTRIQYRDRYNNEHKAKKQRRYKANKMCRCGDKNCERAYSKRYQIKQFKRKFTKYQDCNCKQCQKSFKNKNEYRNEVRRKFSRKQDNKSKPIQLRKGYNKKNIQGKGMGKMKQHRKNSHRNINIKKPLKNQRN